MAMMYQFFINELFGSVWLALTGIGTIFAIISVLGRMGTFLMLSMLGLYFVTMSVLFGGVVLWILWMIGAAGYFVTQMMRFWE